MTATAIVGAQFGSEGKGLIVGHLAQQFDHHVRVGAANAGHTLYTYDWFDGVHEPPTGRAKHVMQQLPCAAYANPDAALYIGPGALISPEILDREIRDLIQWRRRCGMADPVIYIDPRAHVITDWQIADEAVSGLEERIGSTSATAREGVGAAQADRVMRQARCIAVGDYDGAFFTRMAKDAIAFIDVPMLLGGQAKQQILLEGTQGTGLSLTTGDFPYVTSRNTTAAGLCADAGIPPTDIEEVGVVARTYPIRVAGNSGPFHNGSEEITWGTIGIDPENERTTVTKKIRRVATFSLSQIEESIILNGASWIALTFCDYVDPLIAGASTDFGGEPIRTLSAFPEIESMVQTIQKVTGVRVAYLGTGPHSVLEADIR